MAARAATAAPCDVVLVQERVFFSAFSALRMIGTWKARDQDIIDSP